MPYLERSGSLQQLRGAVLGEAWLCSGDAVLTPGPLQKQAMACGTSQEAGPAPLPRRAGAVVAAQTWGWLLAAGTTMVDSGKPKWCTLHFRTAKFFLKGSLREMFSHSWIKARTCTCLLETCVYVSICNSTEERKAAFEELE